MGWLISQALMRDFENSRCLQAQEGESSGANSSDGEQSAPLSETPMPRAYLSSDKMKEFSSLSRSGMTFAPLTESLGEAVSMWCQEASRVRTSAQQDGGQASKASAPASGVKWRELFKRFDPATSSWRTHRCLFDADLPASSVILPRWGMMRDGALSERLTLALPTSGNVSGLWPTPRANDAEKRGDFDLSNPRNGLAAAAKMWPTPCASDNRNRGNADTPAIARRIAAGKQVMLTMSVSGGQLNPNWVEWLMGWPIGWTDLGASGMDRFLQWQRSHGVS